jgi:hypothetical protein
MALLKRLLSILAVLTVAACGGGGENAGTPPFGSGSGSGGGSTSAPSAADLVFVLSATSVSNNGAETVVATATAIDANRNTISGVPVTISADSNAVVTAQGTTTDANGQVNATVGIGSDRTNRTITVTATSGNIKRTALLQVQDTGGSTSGAPSDLLLTLSAPTIANNGSQQVVATATALDAKRNVLPGVVVSISVDADATAMPSGTTTDASGTVTAQIGIGANATNRTITVTATAAGLPARTAALQVVNSPTTSTPAAADLSLALSAGTLVNGGSSTILATVTAVDTNRNAIAGIPVAISVDNNAVATVSGTSTNGSGIVTASIGIGADRSNRSITVTASSGTVTKSATFAVVGATLSASYAPKVDAGSSGNQIEYRLVDANATPMASQTISVTAPGLPSASGRTDANGKFTYTYVAPSAAGTLDIVATAAGDTRTQSVSVQAPGSGTPPAPSVPQSASLTPTPSVVAVNSAGSTTNQVELRALFLGANNEPVPNVRVRFSVDPVNSSDGVATQLGGSVYAYSDATGVARGTFTPGQRSSPTNGVTVRACWDTTDFDVAAPCPAGRLVTNTLTIVSEALSVNIRTNNLIKTGSAGLTYIKEYVVMVVDAAGQAKPDVLITPSIDLTGFYKGVFVWDGINEAWVQRLQLAGTENYNWDGSAQAWVKGGATTQPMCPNEDVNRNGIREAGTYVAGASAPAQGARQEDLNWNGDLDPRKSDVAVKMVGSARTDASGLAIVQIEYGQNVAAWVDYVITVTASGISGTESRARYVGLLYGNGNLPFPASAVTDKTIPPPFHVSPYGKGYVGALPATPVGVCTDSQ